MNNKTIALSCFFGAIIAATILAKPWVTIHHTKPIVVKGYAEMAVVSDSGSLTVSVVATDPSRAQAYSTAGTSLDRVQQIIGTELGTSAQTEELSSHISAIAKVDANGRRTNITDFYSVSRQLRVTTQNVNKLARVARLLFDLNAQDLNVNIAGPDFFVSALDPVKLELVSRATENGKKRAEVMAKDSGERLGPLVSARQGVIQITKPNSSNTSSYGVYDTETIDKVVKLVVTLEYQVAD